MTRYFIIPTDNIESTKEVSLDSYTKESLKELEEHKRELEYITTFQLDTRRVALLTTHLKESICTKVANYPSKRLELRFIIGGDALLEELYSHEKEKLKDISVHSSNLWENFYSLLYSLHFTISVSVIAEFVKQKNESYLPTPTMSLFIDECNHYLRNLDAHYSNPNDHQLEIDYLGQYQLFDQDKNVIIALIEKTQCPENGMDILHQNINLVNDFSLTFKNPFE